MTREEKNEAIVRLFASAMFYGNWKWETPNERVITMLMQDIGMLGFENEDDMIAKTEVNEELYKKAKDLIPPPFKQRNGEIDLKGTKPTN